MPGIGNLYSRGEEAVLFCQDSLDVPEALAIMVVQLCDDCFPAGPLMDRVFSHHDRGAI